MNAKQAEEATGISRRNLRFYEDKGLIHPSRDPENDYRNYSEKDIETLKTIRALRMLDVTIEDIASVLNKEKTLRQVMTNQEEKLKKRQQELETAIHFCRELQTKQPDLNDLLSRMDRPETSSSLFGGWVRDYQSVARAEAQKHFNFVPDDAVTNPREFTAALFAYGEKVKKEIVITREGMEPEFTVDGIEYTAQRIYRSNSVCPIAVVICDAVHPEDFETEVEKSKSIWMRLLYKWWWLIILIIFFVIVEFRVGADSWWIALFMAIPAICTWVMDAVLYRSHSD